MSWLTLGGEQVTVPSDHEEESRRRCPRETQEAGTTGEGEGLERGGTGAGLTLLAEKDGQSGCERNSEGSFKVVGPG